MKLIDLSVVLNEHTPVYPGDPPAKIEPLGVLSKDGYVDHQVTIGTHLGTHIDAPLHMLAGGKNLSQYPIDSFVGRGRYVDAIKGLSLEAIKNAQIQKADIVIIDTGRASHYFEPDYFENYPALNETMANYLIDHQVKMVGFDTGSADILDGFPIHKLLLGHDILIIENLTNVSNLANISCTIYALPLRLELDGAPARVVAALDA